jgi:hypothetical protein
MFVNTNKPLHVSVLFIRPSSGGHMLWFVPLLYCLPLICVRWIFTWYVAVCAYHLFVCVIGALVSRRCVSELLTFDSSQTDLPLTRAPSTHINRWYAHTATYHVNIQRKQISGRHYSNSTKHGIWPSEVGRIKRTETCRGLSVFTNMFLTF